MAKLLHIFSLRYDGYVLLVTIIKNLLSKTVLKSNNTNNMYVILVQYINPKNRVQNRSQKYSRSRKPQTNSQSATERRRREEAPDLENYTHTSNMLRDVEDKVRL